MKYVKPISVRDAAVLALGLRRGLARRCDLRNLIELQRFGCKIPRNDVHLRSTLAYADFFTRDRGPSGQIGRKARAGLVKHVELKYPDKGLSLWELTPAGWDRFNQLIGISRSEACRLYDASPDRLKPACNGV